MRWWTDEEIGVLLDHDGMSSSEVAAMLGRGVDSVKKKRTHLSKGAMRRKEPWTAEEDDVILSTSHLKAREVADLLPGRSKQSVDDRRALLGPLNGVSFAGRKNATEVGTRTLVAKTCPDCGTLLDASWFGFNSHNRAWRRACLRCRPKENQQTVLARAARRADESKARMAKLQEISLRFATKMREPYTSADHAVLADPDLTHFEKALKLGRSYFAVGTMMHTHGYVSKVGRGDPVDDQWLIDAPHALDVLALRSAS